MTRGSGGGAISNSWRTDMDLGDSFNSLVRELDDSVGISQYAGPWGWNDPDLLQVGLGGMTVHEYKAHFAIWALLKSPLLISVDIRYLAAQYVAILQNKGLIAWNQDPLMVAGDALESVSQGPYKIYAGPLSGGRRALVFFNRHARDSGYNWNNFTINFQALGWPQSFAVSAFDEYAGKSIGVYKGSLTAPVFLHDCLALTLTPINYGETEEERQNNIKEWDSWRPWHVSDVKEQKEEKILVEEI